MARSVSGLVFRVVLAGLLIGAFGRGAEAITISITLTGEVSFVGGSAFPGVAVGDSVTYTALYDTDVTADGFGTFVGALSGVSYTFGSFSGTAASSDVLLTYEPLSTLASITAFAPTGLNVGFSFYDTVGPTTLLSSAASLPDPRFVDWLAHSDLSSIDISGVEGESVVATVTGVSFVEVTSVPDEGSTLFLLAIGLAGAVTCGFRARRQSIAAQR